jgi:acetate kinase
VNILLLNAGSSSLKASLMNSQDGAVLAEGTADWAGKETRYRYSTHQSEGSSETVSWKGHGEAVRRVLFDLEHKEPIALPDPSHLSGVGHRVVHGGPFTASVCITPEIRERITALADLAPLHNPPSLETLAAAQAALPGVPHVAVFDTAFHATILPESRTYPVPEKWTQEWGVRRYGFHGLSHAYCARHAAEMLGRNASELRLVICHLGHGCSATAVRGGKSIDTTMGFTPLDGLMMGTRSGSVDPGILTHVMQHHGLTPEQVESALNRESGLLGVSGSTADMRQVLDEARAGRERSQLALAAYAHRARQAVGALTVTMGGVDALIFTAGVGENSGAVRAAICVGLECLGLELDQEANAACRPDADVTRSGSRGRILVIHTREDVTMLREVTQILSKENQQP